jgi:hypothetical protein
VPFRIFLCLLHAPVACLGLLQLRRNIAFMFRG